MALVTVASGLLIEAAPGYPDRLLRSIGHPVIRLGRLVAALGRGPSRPAGVRAAR